MLLESHLTTSLTNSNEYVDFISSFQNHFFDIINDIKKYIEGFNPSI